MLSCYVPKPRTHCRQVFLDCGPSKKLGSVVLPGQAQSFLGFLGILGISPGYFWVFWVFLGIFWVL
jgi:hypothetical protein